MNENSNPSEDETAKEEEATERIARELDEDAKASRKKQSEPGRTFQGSGVEKKG